MKKILIRFLALTVILAMIGLLYPPAPVVNAAGLSNLTDTLSTLADSVLADHAIQFETVTGVASTETIVITFPADFDGSNDPQGALDFSDVDFFEDTTPDQVCDGVEETLVASGASSSEWNAAFSGTENRVLTLTSGGASAIIAATSEVCIKIGENATGGSANSQYINPTTTGEKTVSLTVGSVDSGSYVINIIDDDSVAVSGTVNPSLTFTIVGDLTIGFGTLVSGNARFATDTTGSDGPTSTSAHTMTVATNAASGYTVTYNGATLTDTDPDPDTTISVATVTGDEDGTPGTEQFAIGFTTNGDATITSAYNQVTPTFNYSFVASTTTAIITEGGPTATETFSAFYLANISGDTEAGSYTTSITYIATGNF
ncbi:hypothetical protein KJA15_00320 [Patescibacteria group bacterium]|nr:hypothetical protein [Patescibacteria group bacterium]